MHKSNTIGSSSKKNQDHSAQRDGATTRRELFLRRKSQRERNIFSRKGDGLGVGDGNILDGILGGEGVGSDILEAIGQSDVLDNIVIGDGDGGFLDGIFGEGGIVDINDNGDVTVAGQELEDIIKAGKQVYDEIVDNVVPTLPCFKTPAPTVAPTMTPTTSTSLAPSLGPSVSTAPSLAPSISNAPSTGPEPTVSLSPSTMPSDERPSEMPSAMPSEMPTVMPSEMPSETEDMSVRQNTPVFKLRPKVLKNFRNWGGLS
jgi:hypothetical protein